MNHLENCHNTCCAMLLQPPPGDLTGPYPALPYLKSYAESRGHIVKVRDLGIESLHFLSQEDKVHQFLEHAAKIRRGLESKKSLNSVEQSLYRLLISAAWLEIKPELLSRALRFFKDHGQFYNYRLYKQSSRVLNAFYGLLSAVYFPTLISPSEYPTAQALNSMKRVLAHCNNEINPYVEYYERVIVPEIAAQAPKVVGISMEFASQSVQALVLGNLIKERFPQIHITMGGAYLSQWIMMMGQEQLTELFKCVDSVVCGEGEIAFSELVEAMEADASLDGVSNLTYRDPITGEFHHFESLDYPDIEDLPPPDYSDLDLSVYLIPRPVIPYCISRGCYWGKCVFCQNRYGENRMRRYQTVSVDKAIAEMSQLSQQHGSYHFNFSNDVIDPPYLKRFSEAVLASRKKFVWNTDLRAEKAFTKELCETMARAGLNSAAIGFESGCQKTLDAMNKGKTIDTVARVMKDLYNSGVATQAMGFFGFPGESETDAEMTVAFLEDNIGSLSYYVVGLLMIVPGSRMHEGPSKYGVSSISYEGNALMAPMPVWKSDIRISAAAVNRLYHRIGHLEDVFAINDYPYVGALSTNHSFLYFETGPDVLKRLRREEQERQLKLLRVFGIKDKSGRIKKLKSLVPRLAVPVLVYSSPFPMDRANTGEANNPRSLPSLSGAVLDYVVGPSGIVAQVRGIERQFLEAIDGKKNLRSLLGRFEGTDPDRLIRMLFGLISEGLVVM
jgi:anaerobic magnesium-protoporphyrin IX monomethyl ester cyclase